MADLIGRTYGGCFLKLAVIWCRALAGEESRQTGRRPKNGTDKEGESWLVVGRPCGLSRPNLRESGNRAWLLRRRGFPSISRFEEDLK